MNVCVSLTGYVTYTTSKKPEPQQPIFPAAKQTKAEKRAQHQQLQKELWASAENPGRNLWLEAQGAVPLKQEPKQPMTLLSRKPIAKNGAGADDDDSEEEARKKREASFEERKKKAALEREEKVRKYAEARERIMGSSTPASPAANSRESSQGRDNRKTRGKQHSNMNSRPTSAGQSPARQLSGNAQVFDPEDMGRRLGPRREMASTPKEGEPMRQPRGPDSSGRGGFGFAARNSPFGA